MPVILRVDCDNAYVPYGRLGFLRLALNYLNENLFSPHLKVLGYLSHLEKFLDYMEEKGVRFSIFFKPITIPPLFVSHRIIGRGGLHLYSAKTEKEFFKELEKVSMGLGFKIKGFTKHGSGLLRLSRKHTWRYEPEKYIKWGIRAGLKYFSGNEEGIVTEVKVINRNFFYLPKIFYIEPWLRRSNLEVREVSKYANSDEFCVVLVHPCNWFISQNVRKELDILLSAVSKILSFEEALGII